MRVLAVLLMATLLHLPTARADPGSGPPGLTLAPAPAKVDVERYGLQIVLADLASAAATALATGERSEYGMVVGAIGFGLAPAVIHAAHRNPGGAVLSVAIRVSFVASGFALGLATKDCECEDDSNIGTAITFAAIGGATAFLIDVLVLARVEHVEQPARHAPAIVPTFSADGDRVMLGLSGAL